MMEAILIYIMFVNVAAFFMYGLDKWSAKQQYRRISEKTLLGIAAIGGSIGAYVGMQLFRHKTRKPKFYIGVPIIAIVQLFLMVYIYY